jgi:hypothetical protein
VTRTGLSNVIQGVTVPAAQACDEDAQVRHACDIE